MGPPRPGEDMPPRPPAMPEEADSGLPWCCMWGGPCRWFAAVLRVHGVHAAGAAGAVVVRRAYLGAHARVQRVPARQQQRRRARQRVLLLLLLQAGAARAGRRCPAPRLPALPALCSRPPAWWPPCALCALCPLCASCRPPPRSAMPMPSNFRRLWLPAQGRQRVN